MPEAPESEGGTSDEYWMCDCRLTRNFFVRSVAEHFEYDGDDARFGREYEVVVREAPVGKVMPPVEEVLADVKAQLEERRRAPEEAARRALAVAKSYVRLRPELYTLDR